MGATLLMLDHVARYIRALAGPLTLTTDAGATEIALDTTTGTLKFAAGATTKEVVDLSSAQTITGTKTFAGGLRRSVAVTRVDTTALTAAQSGMVFVTNKTTPTQVFTLPAAVMAGLTYTFVCGIGTAGGEIHIGVSPGDIIVGKTDGAAAGTGVSTTPTTGLLKNTAASNVVGDFVTLVSDGLMAYYMVSIAGAWSAT